jgi:hypothetical protein
MRNLKHLVLLLLTVALARESSPAGGSIYSRYGLGEMRLFGGSRLFAMGGAGIGVKGEGFINRLNPAGLAGITETRFSGGFEFSSVSSKDAFSTGSLARGEFRDLAFAFPLHIPSGATLILDATPYSTVQYAVERTDTQLGIVSHQKLFGTGGLTAFGLGGSYSPLTDLVLGAKLNYLFGGIRQTYQVDFEDFTFTDSDIQRARYYSGFNVTVGAIYSLQDHWTLGAVLSTPASLSVKEETFHILNSVNDTLRFARSSQNIPLGAGFGTAFVLSERYLLTADLYRQFWRPENFSREPSVEIGNSTRLGMGFESLPDWKTDAYFARVAYRVGFSYNQTYLSMHGRQIDEFLVTGGLALPIGVNARLNIGLQVGTRGTMDKNLQRDTILRLSCSLSASERWFIQFADE